MTQHKLSLVVLAGGLGSRFGGNKQIAEIPGLGCTIMELSIQDAVAAGVTQVILIINQAVRPAIEKVILPRLPENIDIVLVEQLIADVPEKFKSLAEKQQKPWGTGHALLCAKEHLHNPAIVITADDYYGNNAFKQLAKHFQTSSDWAMVAYPITNILSQRGGVNRGVCTTDTAMHLANVEEYLAICYRDNVLSGENSNGVVEPISEQALCSMTFWGLTPEVFDVLEAGFTNFLKSYDNDVVKEYYLPDQIRQAIVNNKHNVIVYPAIDAWYGVTYRSELQEVAGKLNELYHGRVSPKSPLFYTKE